MRLIYRDIRQICTLRPVGREKVSNVMSCLMAGSSSEDADLQTATFLGNTRLYIRAHMQ